MDASDIFLYRKEKKGLEKRLKRGEKLRVACAVQQGERMGLLGATATRILFVHKAGLGTKATIVHRGEIASMAREKKRYGILHLKKKKGGVLRFAFTARGDADRFMAALAPPRPKQAGRPSTARPTQAKVRPKPKVELKKSDAGSEPRDTGARRAKAEDLYRRGIITKSEYEWQIESL